MPKKKKLIKIFTLLFFTSVFLFSYNFSKADSLYEDTDGDGYIIWHKNNDLSINSEVYVNPGITLVIEKGSEVKLGQYAYISINGGRIIANGTNDEPIKITSLYPNTSHLIEFYYKKWSNIPEPEPSFLRYVEFSNGGYEEYNPCPECSAFLQYFIPKAFAFSGGIPAVYFRGGKAHLENCNFENNQYADIGVEYWKNDENSENYSLEVVNSNFLGNSDSMAVVSNITCEDAGVNCMKKVLLKNNWYGNYQGPTEENSSSEKGKKIEGVYWLDDYRNNDLISDPTIIIPGILGSFEVGGNLVLDPIFKTYNILINSLDQNGYQENINLFKFPYEWRNSNIITADLLRQKIQDVKNQTKVSKVDLVAHSMGGLVSRQYTEGENYQNDVDQLITLGTPHKGSPKSYLKWEAGEGFDKILDKFSREIFELEAKHNGYDDLKNYIQEKIVSVGELLPDYNYLEENGEMKSYPVGYPRNEFLENLNSSNNLEKLDNIDFVNIISKNKETISKFKVVGSTVEGKWEHGMPENYYNPENEQGIEYGEGDETVPFVSSNGVVSNQDPIVLNATHTQLPSRAQCKILAELSNKTEEDCAYINDVAEIISILTFGVFSPIDIQVIAPDEKSWAGKNIRNLPEADKIVGSYYSGYDFGSDPAKDNEFLTIPNPKDGEYRIITEGTDDDNYKIKVSKITEDIENGNTIESNKTIEGTAISGQIEEKEVEIENGEIVSEEKDTTPPNISIISPEENKTYLNNQTINLSYEIQDDKSTSEKITSKKYLDGNLMTGDSLDSAFQNLGEHVIKITAQDEAGNQAEKEVKFKIETNLGAIVININKYYSQGLIKYQDKKVLAYRLNLIRETNRIIESIEHNVFLRSRLKNILIKILKDQANQNLNQLVVYVQKRSKAGVYNGINPRVGELLTESLNFLKY